jgi:hypothetical protein
LSGLGHQTYINLGEKKMEIINEIPTEVAFIIPYDQLKIIKNNIQEFQNEIQQLKIALKLCPVIGETNGAKEHPAIFHYFFGCTDYYICEYDQKDGLMFGYGILNGDLINSEWGFFNVQEFTQSKYINIDFHFQEQSIEAALYIAYPNYFKKPQSIM